MDLCLDVLYIEDWFEYAWKMQKAILHTPLAKSPPFNFDKSEKKHNNYSLESNHILYEKHMVLIHSHND